MLKLKLDSIKDLLWNKYHYTGWEDGFCSTCGPSSYTAMSEESFNEMLNEIDKWIEETYANR